MIIRDFNTITSVHEKKGGRSPLNVAMSDFNEWIDNCELLQALKSGLQFSWSNGRCDKKRILCNLDRAFYNLQWLNLYSGWKYQVSSRGISDHSFLTGSNSEVPRPLNCPYRFQKMWTTHPNFIQLVKDSWYEEINGNAIYISMNKLKRLKVLLKKWNWEVFGNVQVTLQQAEKKIIETNILFDSDPANIELLNNYITARWVRDIAAQNYHTLLSQKARINWVQFGDANTRFFHTSIKIRQAKKLHY